MLSFRFCWVVCHPDRHFKPFPSSIRDILHDTLTAPQDALVCFIESLDKTYECILLGILKVKWKLVDRLQCGFVSLRPLCVKSLVKIFAIWFGSETTRLVTSWRNEHPKDGALSACSSLITLVEIDDS
jgi:hypothetical protein